MKRFLAAAVAVPALLRCAAPEVEPSWTQGLPRDPSHFPIGVWLQDPALAPKYRDLGINVYVGLRNLSRPEQLDPLREAGMRVILRADEAAPRFRDDRGVAGWMLEDEPDSAQLLGPCKGYGPPVPPEDVAQEYRRLRSEDPTRPILLNLGPGAAWDNCPARGSRRLMPDDYIEYARGGDILSFNFYPVNRDEAEVSGRLEFMAPGVDRLRAASRGRKPVWAFVETTPIRDETRRPSPRAVRAEVWMALIHGARGIVYFAHRFRPRFNESGLLADDEMTRAVAAINREVRDLAPVLNSPAVRGGARVASPVPVDAVVKRHGGSTYLFAAAMRNAPARAAFTVRGLRGRAPVEVLGEGRSIEAVDGAFSDEFEGYGVHLYRIAGEAAGDGRGPEIATSGGGAPAPAAPAESAPPVPVKAPAPAAPRPVPDGAHVAGADCKACHPGEHERWTASRHASDARRTLLNPTHNAAELLSDECLTCHSPFQASALRIGDLVQPLDRKGPWNLVEANAAKWQGIRCEVCHDPAGRAPKLLAFFDPRKRAYAPVKDSTELCQKCHSAADASGGSPRGSVHVTINCAGCHPAGIPVPRDPRGSVHHGAACAVCHFQKGSAMSLSARGACARCHPKEGDKHEDVTKLDTTYRSKESRNDIHSIRCSTCHPDGIPPKKP